MIREILKELGLSVNEIKVYLATVKLTHAGASAIGDEAGLPRQTVYSILENLIANGYVEQSVKLGIKQFAADINDLFEICEKRQKRLVNSRKALEEAIPKFLAEVRPAKELPKVQYYEGRAGLGRLFESILSYYRQHPIAKRFIGYGVNEFPDDLHGFMEEFVQKRHSYGVETNIFVGKDNSPLVGTNEPLGRAIKKLNIEPQPAGMYIIGNRVYLFSYTDSVGVVIENAAMAKLLTSTFDDHWSKS